MDINDMIVQPLYIIYVNGKQMPAWMYPLCTKVVYKESSSDGSNEVLEIYFDDPELQVMESATFIEKQTVVTCKMGYVNDNNYGSVFMGIVQIVENDYPTSGRVTLKITCKDISYSMNESEVTKTWKGLTYSSIFKKICDKYGVKVVVDSTEKILPTNKDTIVTQNSETDLTFVQTMADKCKFRVYFNSVERTGYFVSPKNLPKKTTVVVDYKSGNEKLKAFKPKYNDYDKAMVVTSKNYNISDNAVVGNGNKNTGKLDKSQEKTSKSYTVKSGDCLWNIAKKLYGDGSKYTVIYDANKNIIKSANLIYPGQTLVIP